MNAFTGALSRAKTADMCALQVGVSTRQPLKAPCGGFGTGWMSCVAQFYGCNSRSFLA